MPLSVPPGGGQAPGSAEGGHERAGRRPPPVRPPHRVSAPPPAGALPGSGWGAGEGLEKEVVNRGRREALGGKEGECWKMEVTTEERARETGRERRERDQAGKGQREGHRGVVTDGKGRGWSQEEGRPSPGRRGGASAVGAGGAGRRDGPFQKSGEAVGKQKGRGQAGADLGKTGSQAGAGQRGQGLCDEERRPGGGTCESVCLCFFFSAAAAGPVTLLPSGSRGAVAAGRQPDPCPANPPV